MSKYRAKKCELHGLKFDSIAEMQRYAELALLERARKITGLKVHPRYALVIEDEKIGTFTPDFAYYENEGRDWVVEDVKGVIDSAASLRIRVFQALYHTKVRFISKKPLRVRSFKSGGKKAA